MAYSDTDFARDVTELEARVARYMRNGDLNGVLQVLIEGCGPLWHQTRAVGRIAGSEPLDSLCREVGKTVLSSIDRALGALSAKTSPRPRHMYLVTETYRAGGHGRVLEDLIAAHPDRDHFVIWTNGEHVSADDIPSRIRVDRAPAVYAVVGPPIDKLRRAFELALEIRPDVIFHLGHPNDAVTVALMQPSLARRLVMLHIADCSFALGRYLTDTVHVALGRMFQTFARSAWSVEMPILPLTCKGNDGETAARAKFGGEFVTATAGAGHKYRPRGGGLYNDLLAARFAARGGTHVHFGDLQPEQLESIGNRLATLGHRDRFIHIEHVPQLSIALQEHAVDLYLDSYPVGGARANVEAMAVGLPILAGLADPNLDGVSFCYPQCLTWTTPHELEQLLTSLDAETLAAHAQMSRDYYAENHSTPVFVGRVNELIGLSYADRS